MLVSLSSSRGPSVRTIVRGSIVSDNSSRRAEVATGYEQESGSQEPSESPVKSKRGRLARNHCAVCLEDRDS